MSVAVRYIVWILVFVILIEKGRTAFHERYNVFLYRNGDNCRHTVMEIFPLLVRVNAHVLERRIEMRKKWAVFKTFPLRSKLLYIFLWLLTLGGAVWFIINLHIAHYI